VEGKGCPAPRGEGPRAWKWRTANRTCKWVRRGGTLPLLIHQRSNLSRGAAEPEPQSELQLVVAHKSQKIVGDSRCLRGYHRESACRCLALDHRHCVLCSQGHQIRLLGGLAELDPSGLKETRKLVLREASPRFEWGGPRQSGPPGAVRLWSMRHRFPIAASRTQSHGQPQKRACAKRACRRSATARPQRRTREQRGRAREPPSRPEEVGTALWVEGGKGSSSAFSASQGTRRSACGSKGGKPRASSQPGGVGAEHAKALQGIHWAAER